MAQMLLYITYLTTQLHIFTWVINVIDTQLCDRIIYSIHIIDPLWVEVPITGGFPSQRTMMRKGFHVMTSAWSKLLNKVWKMRRVNLCKCYWFNGTSFSCGLCMMTSSNGNMFRVTGQLCGEFTGPRWIPRTKASDAQLWCFLWCTSE